jgi:hypothetical protein
MKHAITIITLLFTLSGCATQNNAVKPDPLMDELDIAVQELLLEKAKIAEHADYYVQFHTLLDPLFSVCSSDEAIKIVLPFGQATLNIQHKSKKIIASIDAFIKVYHRAKMNSSTISTADMLSIYQMYHDTIASWHDEWWYASDLLPLLLRLYYVDYRDLLIREVSD